MNVVIMQQSGANGITTMMENDVNASSNNSNDCYNDSKENNNTNDSLSIVALNFTEGQKVSGKQNLFLSFSRTLFNWPRWNFT